MPRLPASLLALLLGSAAALALASCGSEDAQLLPGETAREITANLDAVDQLAGEDDCLGAESAALQVSEQIDALEGVDRKLKQALEQGAARLEEVIASCEEEEAEAIDPATIPPEDEVEEEEPEEGREGENGDEGEEGKGPEAGPGTDGKSPTPPPLPPQAEGEAKGRPEAPAPEEEGEGGTEGPSGGVSPGAPAAEGDED